MRYSSAFRTVVPVICAVLCACGSTDRQPRSAARATISALTDTAPGRTSPDISINPSRPTGNAAPPAVSTASYNCTVSLNRPTREGTSGASSPPCDFSLSLSSLQLTTQMGTATTPITVSTTALNGFSGSVAIAVAGLPAGVTCSPDCAFMLTAGKSAQLSLMVPGNAIVANVPLTIQATSGNLSHTMPLMLSVTTSLQGYWNLWTGTAVPQGNPAPVSGLLFVSGWAFETIPITAVNVLIDGTPLTTAFYGLARRAGPLQNGGFSAQFDTSKFANGTHTLSVTATDTASNVSIMLNYPTGLQGIQITVNNPAPPATGPVANLALNTSTTSLIEGTIVQYTSSATDSSNNPVYPQFTWSSSDSTIAKVTPTGVVYPLAAGSATISVSAGGLTQRAMVTVTAGSGAPGTIQTSVGPEEVVNSYTHDACMEGDVPDGGARAVRLSDGSILLIAGNGSLNFADVGPDFWSLKRRCTPTLASTYSPMASTFQNWEWIYALYNDGTTIHALVHNEFHDLVSPGCQSSSCQYNSVTYASSTDGGNTFQMNTAPLNVVAPPPVVWTPPSPGIVFPFYGSQEPTNIVHAADGYYYARFGVFPPPGQPYYARACVMRTQTLSDASSWRAWDGTAFELQMTDPYITPGAALCADTANGPYPGESLTFNSYLNMYMSMGLDSDPPAGTNCGFHFALSSDLVHWAQQQFIAPAYVPAPSQCQKPGSGGLAGSNAYASIIDPDDPSDNFETPGRTGYIYFTRINDNSEDRDLVRIPVMFTKY